MTYVKNFCEYEDYKNGILKRGSAATNKGFFIGYELKKSIYVFQLGILHDFGLNIVDEIQDSSNAGSHFISKKIRTMRTETDGEINNIGLYSNFSILL